MRVAATKQVMLKVRFLEVDRSSGRDLGVNLFSQGRGRGISGLGNVSAGSRSATNNAQLEGVFAGAASSTTPFGALLAQVINANGIKIDALVTALEQKGLVKTLAEPNLIA
jgi:pilus assembly protein CpaC